MIRWKSRFYLMSRNIISAATWGTMALEKPVLFDVTELFHKNHGFSCFVLEKPVLFDVTELFCPQKYSLCRTLEKPVLFDVTELYKDSQRQPESFSLEKPVLFDVTELNVVEYSSRKITGWKSRFYLMSRNL